ncbi:MAG: hypothetical protein A2252_00620 [Elusimicrobia bacterium RIFOXYA2_FULL_39_19]|nr:MAG: hypothetical protein A2252_00620 [Elusimicrobia bacterium RIFOXYA2_FULL_39_19]
MKKLLIIVLIVIAGVFAARDLSKKSFVLYYHNVDGYKSGLRSVYIQPFMFDLQMKYLKLRGYRTISFEEMIEALRQNVTPPKKTFVITFDDGYKNNFKRALPILNKYGFTATVFVAVNEIGKTLAHERTYPEARMSSKEIKEISKYWSIGSHTMNHKNVASLRYQDLKYELCESKKSLEKLTEKKVNMFCYPMGRFDDDVKNMAKKAGYIGACTTHSGLIIKRTDVYEIPRVEWKGVESFSFINYWDLKWFFLKIFLGV